MGFADFKSVGGHLVSQVGSTPIRSRQLNSPQFSSFSCNQVLGYYYNCRSGGAVSAFIMENNGYDPGVYARLELVRKQFRNNLARQKKFEAAERRQAILNRFYFYLFSLGQPQVVRTAAYVILAALVLAVIAVLIMGSAPD